MTSLKNNFMRKNAVIMVLSAALLFYSDRQYKVDRPAVHKDQAVFSELYKTKDMFTFMDRNVNYMPIEIRKTCDYQKLLNERELLREKKDSLEAELYKIEESSAYKKENREEWIYAGIQVGSTIGCMVSGCLLLFGGAVSASRKRNKKDYSN
jgi:hypothetical protein